MEHDIRFQEFIEDWEGELIRVSYGDNLEASRARDEVFTEMVVEQLEGLGILADTELCSFESRTTKGQIRIDGYAFSDNYYFLTLITTLYKPVFGTRLTQTEVQQAEERALRLFQLAEKEYHKGMEPSSDQYSMMQELNKRSKNVQKIKVILVTNGEVPTRLIDNNSNFEIWDMIRIYRSFEFNYEPIQIDFQKQFNTTLACLPLDSDSLGYQVFLAIFPGSVLEGLYDTFGSRLLELNVRAYLQAKGKINKGISQTIKSAPQNFMAFNNGICATAEEVGLTVGPNGQIRINSISGLQVVNGGQTMASIHRAGKLDHLPLDQVFVQAKITVIDQKQVEEFVPLISKYANSQNKVNDADFSSNDPFHVQIQRLSEKIWLPGHQSRWFYERARGQYQVAKARFGGTLSRKKEFEKQIPPGQKFTKTDLARYLNSWHMLPHIVSRGNQKNFVEFMSHLQSGLQENWEPDQFYYRDLIAKAILYNRAQKIVRSRKDRIPAYQVYVVNYLVSYLVFRSKGNLNLSHIWEKQTISDELADILYHWSVEIYSEIVRTANKKNISEWCKRPGCWEVVKSLTLEFSTSFPEYDENQEDLSAREGASRGMTLIDKTALGLVMKIPTSTWESLLNWSKTEKRLNSNHKGVVDAMIGFSKINWARLPTPKQVSIALKALETYEDATALPEG